MRRLGIAGEVIVVRQRLDRRQRSSCRASRRPRRSSAAQGLRQRPSQGIRRGAAARFIVMGDCDDSYDFTDLGRFVDRLRGGADVVMGNRLNGEIKPGAHAVAAPLDRQPRADLVSQPAVPHRRRRRALRHAGSAEAVDSSNLHMPGMELASEMVIKNALAGHRIEEVPITLWPDGRDRPPHLRSFRDGWRHLRFMLMCSPTFLFLLPGLATDAARVAGHSHCHPGRLRRLHRLLRPRLPVHRLAGGAWRRPPARVRLPGQAVRPASQPRSSAIRAPRSWPASSRSIAA